MVHIPSMAYLPELLNKTIMVKEEHTFVSIGLCKLVCWWSQNLLINVADIEFSLNFPFLVLSMVQITLSWRIFESNFMCKFSLSSSIHSKNDAMMSLSVSTFEVDNATLSLSVYAQSKWRHVVSLSAPKVNDAMLSLSVYAQSKWRHVVSLSVYA